VTPTSSIGYLVATFEPPKIVRNMTLKNANYSNHWDIVIGNREDFKCVVNIVETTDLHPIIDEVFELSIPGRLTPALKG
jgi:hypothetical protein